MYQVIVNNEFYVKDVDNTMSYSTGKLSYFEEVVLTKKRQEGKFFNKEDAKYISEKLNAKIVEYKMVVS